MKIRPADRRQRGYECEWQPIPTYNGKWYGINRKNIWPLQKADGATRRLAAIEARYIINALINGVPVQCRAAYERKTHTLFILPSTIKEVR